VEVMLFVSSFPRYFLRVCNVLKYHHLTFYLWFFKRKEHQAYVRQLQCSI
jgi:hypothetical protein